MFAVIVASAIFVMAPAYRPSAADLARALSERTGNVVDPADIRLDSCRGPDEEPTEMQCSWHQKIEGRWQRERTWFAVDGKGWHVIDWPPEEC